MIDFAILEISLFNCFYVCFQIEETVTKSYKTLQDRRADEFKVQFVQCILLNYNNTCGFARGICFKPASCLGELIENQAVLC